MALTPGTRLGVFELVDLLGRGGMGEVYRATDTKLKRQVAIKILPPSFAADHDRLARFQREAKVLASLPNQPKIASEAINMGAPFVISQPQSELTATLRSVAQRLFKLPAETQSERPKRRFALFS